MKRWCEDYSRRGETDNRKEKPRRSGANSAQPSHLAVEFAERVMDTLGDRDPAEQRQ